jgi:hypothetical protein
VGHVAQIGEERNTYRKIVGKHERSRQLERPRNRLEENTEMDLKEVGMEVVEYIRVTDRDQWLAVVNFVMNICISYNFDNFLLAKQILVV